MAGRCGEDVGVVWCGMDVGVVWCGEDVGDMRLGYGRERVELKECVERELYVESTRYREQGVERRDAL